MKIIHSLPNCWLKIPLRSILVLYSLARSLVRSRVSVVGSLTTDFLQFHSLLHSLSDCARSQMWKKRAKFSDIRIIIQCEFSWSLDFSVSFIFSSPTRSSRYSKRISSFISSSTSSLGWNKRAPCHFEFKSWHRSSTKSLSIAHSNDIHTKEEKEARRLSS